MGRSVRRLLRVLAAGIAAVALAAAPAADTFASIAAPSLPPAGAEEANASSPFFGVSGLAAPRIRHVIVISIDGLRSDAITRLGEAGTPALHRLIREGASTLNARNMVERTVTLPNHTSMITGQRINADEGGHGVGFNADDGRTVHASAGRYVASVFDVVHDAGGSTGFYVGKSKFELLDRSWDEVNGALDTVGEDDGRDKIDRFVRGTPAGATDSLIERLSSAEPDTFSFLHLPQPDQAGHKYRWASKRYLRAVTQADAMVGEVLAAIDASPERTEDTVVILTTDHGGTGHGHSDTDRYLNYRIPFMVWGPDVAAGADLYALNPGTRLDPGTARPGYDGPQPIRNGEVANLVTDLLGEPAVPGSLFDLDQDLEVDR